VGILSQTLQPENAPPLFAVLVLPYAFTTSATVLLMPYLLRKYGMSVDQIAKIVVVANLPSIWSFFWSPLADVGLARRTWLIFSALGAGLAGGAAILGVQGSPAVLTALLFLMNAFSGLLSSACGALLTAMPIALRGRSAGWYQGGNTGGAAIGGGLFIWLADHASLSSVAAVVLAAMLLPALTAFLIKELPPIRRAIRPQIAGLAHDMGEIFRSRRTWIGFVFLLSPVGSAAIGNLISGMGQDYHASGNEVLWVTGIGGGLLSALGCLIGGVVADKIGRMFAYALAGGMAALFGVYLGFAPATPVTYGAGYSGYAVSAGFAYAVFTAMVLDILGRRKHAAASGYAVLNSAGNLPIVYMTWLDGMGYQRWGARGLMATDAAANGGFGIVLLLVAIFLGRHWNHLSQENGRNSSG
jgi:MFS family permease